ncbi:MAG TPA: CopG family transcriptional regulator [Bacillota bacterium]|nr:CopG family transcriptional regulator [Bacillota bacterium]
MEQTEKATFNLSPVDLGKMDVLVAQGFYANRTDFVRSAVRRQLELNENQVDRFVDAHSSTVGIACIDRRELKELVRAGTRRKYTIVGLAIIPEDVDAELADAAIESLRVYGALRASRAVRERLGDRITGAG